MSKPKKPSFNWQDPLLLDEALGDDERAVRDAARAFAQKKLAPRLKDAFRHEKHDPKLIREFGDQGLLGVSLEDYGCPGGNHVMYGLWRARSSASTRATARRCRCSPAW